MDDGLNACTQLVFVAVTRSDRGVYRVVIENENDIIPLNQSRREANFQLNITGESLVSVLIPPSPGGKKKRRKKKAGLGLGTRLPWSPAIPIYHVVLVYNVSCVNCIGTFSRVVVIFTLV